MATNVETPERDLVLTPPEPVPTVAAERAAGLVPIYEAKKTQLDTRVETFVDDLVAQDVNSPEFGKRVDAITAMGAKEIREAAGQSNRFLDRPIRAMDKDTGVGADLAETTTVPLIRHYTSNLSIDVVGRYEANARCYFLALTETGVDHWGRYRDRLVPSDDGRWRFASRFVRTDGAVPGAWAESRI